MPHFRLIRVITLFPNLIMKKFFVLLVASAGLMLISCVGDTHSDYTPEIMFSDMYLNPTFHGDTLVSAEDTMAVKYDADLNAYVMTDTLSVTPRDSVVFAVRFWSMGNDLIATRINFDTTALNLQITINDEIRQVLAEKSNLRTAQLYYNPGYNMVSFAAGYAPLKEGLHKLEFVVESDSKYSPVSYLFLQPVVTSRAE